MLCTLFSPHESEQRRHELVRMCILVEQNDWDLTAGQAMLDVLTVIEHTHFVSIFQDSHGCCVHCLWEASFCSLIIEVWTNDLPEAPPPQHRCASGLDVGAHHSLLVGLELNLSSTIITLYGSNTQTMGMRVVLASQTYLEDVLVGSLGTSQENPGCCLTPTSS